MPTQLEYGIRRAACIRELGKRMHNGLSHYFTGPKSYYPNKVLNTPPPISQAIIDAVPGDLKNLSLADEKTLRDFPISFGRSVRQHTVRDKSKEVNRPATISYHSLCSSAKIRVMMSSQKSWPQVMLIRQAIPSYPVIQCDILFKRNETTAVKHGRKKKEWGFFLAVLIKDLLIKKECNDGIDFVEDYMKITWLDNCETGDKYAFKESLSDCRNSPYSVFSCYQLFSHLLDE